MRRVELAHYTREQVGEHLADALALIGEVGVPDELRAVAYAEAVKLLAAKQITVEQFAAPVLSAGGRPL